MSAEELRRLLVKFDETKLGSDLCPLLIEMGDVVIALAQKVAALEKRIEEFELGGE